MAIIKKIIPIGSVKLYEITPLFSYISPKLKLIKKATPPNIAVVKINMKNCNRKRLNFL